MVLCCVAVEGIDLYGSGMYLLLYCIVLYGIVLCCTVLYGVVLCGIVLYCMVLYCIVWHCSALCCIVVCGGVCVGSVW